jgi:hypothetical protein
LSSYTFAGKGTASEAKEENQQVSDGLSETGAGADENL